MLQDLKLQGPTFAHDRFFVEKRGLTFQTWSHELLADEEVEFFYEPEQQWIKGTVHRWHIDDASGNCPESDAHYFIVVRRGGTYKLDLYEGLLIRFDAPTDEELVARSGGCDGGDFYDQGPYAPESYEQCMRRGDRYITQHGQHLWYCEKHVPHWLLQVRI